MTTADKILKKIQKLENLREMAKEGCREYFSRRHEPLFASEYAAYRKAAEMAQSALYELDGEYEIAKRAKL